MRIVGIVAALVWSASCASSQVVPDASPAVQLSQTTTTATNEPPNYANFSIMLVNPAGGAVVLMHNPKNELEYVNVQNTQQALSAGYVPARAVEIGELINSLREDNIRLAAENVQLKNQQPQHVAVAPTQTLNAQAEVDAQKAARRQQLIQSWIMLQNLNSPQTLNLNVRDCTRLPALCAGK